MEDRESRLVQFDRLNPLGKAVFLTGTAVRATAGLIDYTLRKAADVAVDAERAFKQGLDANVEEAKILGEEEREGGKGERGKGGRGA